MAVACSAGGLVEQILQELRSIPGVVGALVCGRDGEVVGRAFASLFDEEMLAEAGRAVAQGCAELGAGAGALSNVEFRYGDARLVVRPLGGAALLVLCTRAVDAHLLTLSLSVAAAKLAAELPARPASPQAAAPLARPARGAHS